jgi:O-antigen/teichoic acid export membrane protein
MGDDPTPILKTALLSSLILFIIPTRAIAAFPDLVLTILYGEAYVGAADALVPLCFAMTFFGIGNLFLVFGLASDGHRFVAIIALFSILEIIVMGLFHNTIEQLALGILAVSALMCLFCSLYLLQNVKNGSGPYWASRNI